MFPTCTVCTVACTGPRCTCQDSLSQDLLLDRSVSHVIRYWWSGPCLGSEEAKLFRSHPSETRGDWAGSQVKQVGQFQFSMNFPEIMQYYARMRPGHLRLFDNKSEKLGQSQESSRCGLREKIRSRERILFFIFISLWYENEMWKLITLTNVVRRERGWE